LGVFNYPKIDWRHRLIPIDGAVSEEIQLIKTLRDMYLHQHVDNPTRGRGAIEKGLLEVILTNKEGMLNNINYLSILRKTITAYSVSTFKRQQQYGEHV